jgi:diguanylate cyclase (GGDEF)-like protein
MTEQRRSLAGESGIFNQDVFNVLFSYEINRIRRYPGPTTLLHIALAVDNFAPELIKKANYSMANLLNRILRISDVPAHYGDEFLILLPGTDEAGGRAVAERILGHYRTTQNLSGVRTGKLDAYIGLTSRSARDAVSPEELLAEAAVAMNEARIRKSFTYIAFSAIAPDLPKPK